MAIGDVGLGIILLVAFAPPLLYMVRIRNVERFNRNPMSTMLLVFTWGAIAAVVIAVILEEAASARLDTLRPTRIPSEMWLAVILAPLAEEPAKVAGLFLLRRKRLLEEEDGLIYGAAAGLGFAATEGLLYEIVTLAKYDVSTWIAVAIMRTLTSTLLHASSSAIAGWGIAKARGGAGSAGTVLKFLLIAMVLHGLFNLFTSIALFTGEEYTATLVSLLILFVFAGALWRFTRAKIRELDRRPPTPRIA